MSKISWNITRPKVDANGRWLASTILSGYVGVLWIKLHKFHHQRWCCCPATLYCYSVATVYRALESVGLESQPQENHVWALAVAMGLFRIIGKSQEERAGCDDWRPPAGPHASFASLSDHIRSLSGGSQLFAAALGVRVINVLSPTFNHFSFFLSAAWTTPGSKGG